MHLRAPVPQNLPSVLQGRADDGAGHAAAGTLRELECDTTLYAEGDVATHWYEVASGIIRMCKMTADGRRQIVAFHVAGDIFGFDDTNRHHGLSAEAASTAGNAVVRHARSRIDMLAMTDIGVLHWLYDKARQSTLQAHAHLLLIGKAGSSERVASFLLDMQKRLWAARRLEKTDGPVIPLGGQPAGPAGEFILPLTGRDIGDHLCLTLETVSRTFNALQRQGIMTISRSRRVTVIDHAALERMGSLGDCPGMVNHAAAYCDAA